MLGVIHTEDLKFQIQPLIRPDAQCNDFQAYRLSTLAEFRTLLKLSCCQFQNGTAINQNF